MNDKRSDGEAAFEEESLEGTLHEMLDEESARSDPSFDFSKAPRASWTHQLQQGVPAFAPACRPSSFSWAASVVVFVLTTAFWGAVLVFWSWKSGLLALLLAPGTVGSGGGSAAFAMSVEPYDMGEKHSIFSHTHFIDCGTSTEEARRKGCVYDILANHYVHRSCFDEISTQSYMDEGTSWIGFLDKNKTTQLGTIEEMGDYDVYWTSQRDHIVHCGEMWKRQYRAFTQNWRYIDAITANEEHTFHCANYLVAMTDWAVIAGRDWRKEPNTVEVGFAGCYDRATVR